MLRQRVVRLFVWPMVIMTASIPAAVPAFAQTASVAVTGLDRQQRFTAEQIDNLTGPIALYPDALLAQVLVAATFPDQIQDAATWVRANGTDGVDNQPWDVSVKAVAHYPSALNSMADKIDWTTALGKAYASQSSEVMASVQRLRGLAAQQGNLNNSSQQQVVRENDTYEIVPTQTQIIYVPVYDPYIVYTQPIFNIGFSSRYWSYGVGFPIGSWLSYDCDWRYGRVYYNGWAPAYYAYAGGWRERSRPFVRVTDIYISPRYRDVYVNHNVAARYVDYRNVDRYASVHRGQHFEGRPDNRRDDNPRDGRDVQRGNDQRGDAQRGQQNNGGYGNRNGGGSNTGGNVNGTNNGNSNGSNGGRGRNDGNNSGNTNGNGNSGNNRTPPQGRRNETPVTNSQQPQIVMPSRRNDTAKGAQEQMPTQVNPRRNDPPVVRSGETQVFVPQQNSDRGNNSGDRNSRFGIPQQQPQQQQQQPQQQPQQQQQQQQQQRVQPQPQPRFEPQRAEPPRVESPRQPSAQPPQVVQPQREAKPTKQAEPPKSERGRGGDGRGNRS